MVAIHARVHANLEVADAAAPVKAEIIRKAFRGSEFLFTLRLANGQTVMAQVPSAVLHTSRWQFRTGQGIPPRRQALIPAAAPCTRRKVPRTRIRASSNEGRFAAKR